MSALAADGALLRAATVNPVSAVANAQLVARLERILAQIDACQKQLASYSAAIAPPPGTGSTGSTTDGSTPDTITASAKRSSSSSSSSAPPLPKQLDLVASLLEQLQSQAPHEFRAHQLQHLAVDLGFPVWLQWVHDWQPMRDAHAADPIVNVPASTTRVNPMPECPTPNAQRLIFTL